MPNRDDAPRLVVIGGSGELGQALVRAAATWETHATFFRHKPAIPAASWRFLDITDRAAVDHLAETVKPAAVLHVGFSDRSRRHGDTDESFSEALVNGAVNVARAAHSVSARLVVLSTDLVFDGTKGDYVEEDEAHPIMAYGAAKAAMESALLALNGDIAVVRTSLILTLQPMGRHVSWIVEAVRRGERVSLFTDELRNPIWSDELAAALLELARLDFRGLLHIAGPEATTRYVLALRIAEQFDLDANLLVPALSASSGVRRPLNCTLSSDRARRLLGTHIHGVSYRFGGKTVPG